MNFETGWWIPDTDQSVRKEFTTEFLKREIEVRIFSGKSEIENQLRRAQMGKKVLVFTDSSVQRLNNLERFPKNSVILFVLSDETYDLKLNLKALINNRVFAIVRDYPLGKLGSVSNLPRVLFSTLRRARHFPSLRGQFLEALASGLYMTCVQLLFRALSSLSGKRIFEMDLGYGSGFCERFVDFHGLQENQSLFEYAISLNSRCSTENKAQGVFFAGQRGKFNRQLFLNEIISAGLSIDRIHDSYELGGSAENRDRYFEGLRQSRFSLCPAGNYSRRTFRFYESLIAGAYPLSERFTLSDPLFESEMKINWTSDRVKVLKVIEGKENLQEIRDEIIRKIRHILDNNLKIRELIASRD